MNTTTFNIRSSNTLQSIDFHFNLIYIWRHRNPGKREFTRSMIVQNTLKQSRIDYFLISRNIIPFVINFYITHTLISDHEFVGLKLDFSKIERGGGIWIFNNQLLKDEIFNNAINDIINNSCECPLLETEPLIWWDNLKYKMKKRAMYHATKKRKLENELFLLLIKMPLRENMPNYL